MNTVLTLQVFCKDNFLIGVSKSDSLCYYFTQICFKLPNVSSTDIGGWGGVGKWKGLGVVCVVCVGAEGRVILQT